MLICHFIAKNSSLEIIHMWVTCLSLVSHVCSTVSCLTFGGPLTHYVQNRAAASCSAASPSSHPCCSVPADEAVAVGNVNQQILQSGWSVKTQVSALVFQIKDTTDILPYTHMRCNRQWWPVNAITLGICASSYSRWEKGLCWFSARNWQFSPLIWFQQMLVKSEEAVLWSYVL